MFHTVNPQEYRLKEYDVGDGYRYAICCLAEGEPFPSSIRFATIPQILMELE